MGANILINKGNSLYLQTHYFDELIEVIRNYFDEKDSVYMKEIYLPYDESLGATTFIILHDLNEEGFNAFCRAVKKAYEKCIMGADEEKAICEKYWGTDESNYVWHNLITMLKADRRYDDSSGLRLL